MHTCHGSCVEAKEVIIPSEGRTICQSCVISFFLPFHAFSYLTSPSIFNFVKNLKVLQTSNAILHIHCKYQRLDGYSQFLLIFAFAEI